MYDPTLYHYLEENALWSQVISKYTRGLCILNTGYASNLFFPLSIGTLCGKSNAFAKMYITMEGKEIPST